MLKELLINLGGASVLFLLGVVTHKMFVSSRLKEHNQIKKQAFTDPLTGRGNRHRFLADMDEHIKRNNKFAICFMDLDGFKHVNDTLGHDAGDILLIELSKMLENNLTSNSCCSDWERCYLSTLNGAANRE